MLVVGSFLPGFGLERYAGGNLAVEIKRTGGQVITASHCRSRALRLADMLSTAYRRRSDFDVAHVTVFSGLAFIYAECVCALMLTLRKPATLCLHGGNLPDFAGRYPRRTRRLLQRVRRVVCPSGYLMEKMRLFREELDLIPNVIQIKQYCPKSQERPGFRILWLRAFHDVYQPEMAVAVLASVLKVFPQATLTMVGPDKGDGSLAKTRMAAERTRVLERITFTGPVPKEIVPQIMRQHDVFINTPSIDNMPVSVIEAMACGLPVVSTNVAGIPYLIENGRTGLLVSPGDSQGMAAAVRSLFAQPGFARRLSRHGREVAESLDWDVVLPKWRSLFNAVMNGQR